MGQRAGAVNENLSELSGKVGGEALLVGTRCSDRLKGGANRYAKTFHGVYQEDNNKSVILVVNSVITQR